MQDSLFYTILLPYFLSKDAKKTPKPFEVGRGRMIKMHDFSSEKKRRFFDFLKRSNFFEIKKVFFCQKSRIAIEKHLFNNSPHDDLKPDAEVHYAVDAGGGP